MASPATIRVIYGCAIAVWVLGVGWSAKTVSTLKLRAEQCRNRHQQITELQAIEARSQRAEGARAYVQAMAAGSIADVEARIKSALPGSRATLRSHVTSLGDGWSQQENELELDDVPLAALLAAVTALEQERPPWRLRACDIRASPSTPGNGQVVLTVACIQPNN